MIPNSIARRIIRGALCACLALDTAAPVAAEDTERMVVISNDERVGELTASLGERTVSIDYYVDNNGRGPKIKEQLVLGANGRAVDCRRVAVRCGSRRALDMDRWRGLLAEPGRRGLRQPGFATLIYRQRRQSMGARPLRPCLALRSGPRACVCMLVSASSILLFTSPKGSVRFEWTTYHFT